MNLEEYWNYIKWLGKSLYKEKIELLGDVNVECVFHGEVTYKELSKMKILVPPLNEQKEIAEFLDTKCEKIDRLNENYTKQITALKEYKKSLIYECVTGKKEI